MLSGIERVSSKKQWEQSHSGRLEGGNDQIGEQDDDELAQNRIADSIHT